MNFKTRSGEAFSIERGRIAAAKPGFECAPGTAEPGWIDSHCHILPGGLDLLKLNLSGCRSKDAVLAAVERSSNEGEGWLLAVHYDQNRFPNAEHLTRWELDKVCPDRPALLRHSNGHASVCNTAALIAAGVSESQPDPAGGTYGRDAAGALNGVLLETAHEHVTGRAPIPTLEQMVEAIVRAGGEMASMGITAATDMMTGRWNLEQELTAYRLASEQGCPIRLRLCIQWSTLFGKRALDPHRRQELIDAMDPAQCKVIGAKIFADGAIASATAAIHRTYKTGGQGQLIYNPERLTDMVVTATREGWNVAVHSIGDRSTDHVMDAFETSGEPDRHRLEHVMILSDAQIARLQKLNCQVTLQPEFLVRFGHAYRAQLPDDVWPSLKRARSLTDAGLRVSFSSDRPIVPGSPEDGIRTATHRPEGFDDSEAVTWAESANAWTAAAAAANYDGSDFGSLAPGSYADFRLVDQDGSLLQTWTAGSRVF